MTVCLFLLLWWGGLVFPVAHCGPSSWRCEVIRIPLETVHRTVKGVIRKKPAERLSSVVVAVT
jgi:hypothetical protein